MGLPDLRWASFPKPGRGGAAFLFAFVGSTVMKFSAIVSIKPKMVNHHLEVGHALTYLLD